MGEFVLIFPSSPGFVLMELYGDEFVRLWNPQVICIPSTETHCLFCFKNYSVVAFKYRTTIITVGCFLSLVFVIYIDTEIYICSVMKSIVYWWNLFEAWNVENNGIRFSVNIMFWLGYLYSRCRSRERECDLKILI